MFIKIQACQTRGEQILVQVLTLFLSYSVILDTFLCHCILISEIELLFLT